LKQICLEVTEWVADRFSSVASQDSRILKHEDCPVNHSMNACRLQFRLITGISVSLSFVPQFALSPTLRAAESPLAHLGDGGARKMPSQMFWSPADRSANSSAVDANGVRHRGIDYGSKRPPWLQDVIKTVAPDYPDRDRIFRMKETDCFSSRLI
jgi:hypothetical protein